MGWIGESYHTSVMAPKRLFAINSAGKVVHIKESYRKVRYRCSDTGCRSRLIAKKGPHKAHHFSHYDKTAKQICPSNRKGAIESDNHKCCKKHVGENIHEYAFQRHHCVRCKKWSLYDTSGCTAEVEKKVDGSDRIADVRLTGSTGKVKSIVEILETHLVCKQKHSEMQALGVSVIEVATEEVLLAITNPDLNDRGVKYFVKTIDFYRDVCPECTTKERERLERIRAEHETLVRESSRAATAAWFADRDKRRRMEEGWDIGANGFPLGRETILHMLAPREFACPKCTCQHMEQYYLEKYGECNDCHEKATGTPWRKKEQAIRNKAKRAKDKLLDKGQCHEDDHNFHLALETYQRAMDVYKQGHRPLVYPEQVRFIAGKIAHCEKQIDK
jgi:glutaredoxin-related protein